MAKSNRASEPTARFAQLCREISQQLRCKLSDPRVEHIATLRLMRENIQARLLLGERVEPNEVLRLDEALSYHLPPPASIELKIAKRVVGYYRCRHCGKGNDVEYVAPRKPQDKPPPTIDAAIVSEPSPAPSATPVAVSWPSATVEVEPYRCIKDTRPTAPSNPQDGGALVWSGSASGLNGYPYTDYS